MNMVPHGEYTVYTKQGDQWVRQGVLASDRFFRTHELELNVEAGTKTLEVRIEQKGDGMAHLDSVLLNGQPPGTIAEHGKATLEKLSTNDFDVIDASGKTFDLSFDTSGSKVAKLALTGRVKAERIAGRSFKFPASNLYQPMNEASQFYSYRLGSDQGSLRVDGDLSTESLGSPFFRERSLPGTGHPSGDTFGWVSDDGKNLYVAIDFTADNTMDGDKDFAAVYAKTAHGLKEFKVSVPDQAYGRPGFTYTKKVAYQHKTYEFSIPLNERRCG